jgi:hypothetical protein
MFKELFLIFIYKCDFVFIVKGLKNPPSVDTAPLTISISLTLSIDAHSLELKGGGGDPWGFGKILFIVLN